MNQSTSQVSVGFLRAADMLEELGNGVEALGLNLGKGEPAASRPPASISQRGAKSAKIRRTRIS